MSNAASDALTNALSVAKKIEGDAGSAEQHPIPDLIEADRYLASKAAAKSPRRGILFSRLVPDGTVNRC